MEGRFCVWTTRLSRMGRVEIEKCLQCRSLSSNARFYRTIQLSALHMTVMKGKLMMMGDKSTTAHISDPAPRTLLYQSPYISPASIDHSTLKKNASAKTTAAPHRGTSLIRKRLSIGPYSRAMPRDLWWS